MKADEQEVHDNFAALKNILHDTQKELATIKEERSCINARAFKAEAEYATILAYCRELEDIISRLTATKEKEPT